MQQIPINAQIILDNLRPVLTLGFVSFALSLALTPIYTTLAYRFKWWKKPHLNTISGEVAKVFQKFHLAKHQRHIPTMAGVIGIISLAVVTLTMNLDRGQTWLPLAAVAGAGLIGLIDDMINLRGNDQGTAGLNAKTKLLFTILIAVGLSYWFVFKLGYDRVHLPFAGEILLPAAVLFGAFVFIIVATANAVNITDGLDGLAGGLLTTAFGAFGLIAFLQGNFGLAAFCFSIVGVLLSFLWFNIFPARFFMGDVGSFAWGTALAVVAIMTNSILLIPVIGVLFVAEVGSALLQMISKKFFGRRIFKAAPLHHHLEAGGWPEAKVTMRFWVLGQAAAVLGLLVAVLGGFVTL